MENIPSELPVHIPASKGIPTKVKVAFYAVLTSVAITVGIYEVGKRHLPEAVKAVRPPVAVTNEIPNVPEVVDTAPPEVNHPNDLNYLLAFYIDLQHKHAKASASERSKIVAEVAQVRARIITHVNALPKQQVTVYLRRFRTID